jgi:hypothetical protein
MTLDKGNDIAKALRTRKPPNMSTWEPDIVMSKASDLVVHEQEQMKIRSKVNSST